MRCFIVQGQGNTQLGIAKVGTDFTAAIMGLGANLAQALADVKQRNTILEQNGIMGAQFTALSTALTNLTNLVAQLKPASSGS